MTISIRNTTKRFARNTFFVLLIVIGGIVVWSLIPNPTGPFPPDPAVVYANKTGDSSQPYSEAYFEHEGVSLHYVEAGVGDVVVLIHGFPSYWYGMRRQMEALKTHYRVIAIDALGAGRSDAPNDQKFYKLETQVALLAALIDRLAPGERIHLIGHDWGAAYAFTFAQSNPEKVKTVTGISAPPHSILLQLLETDEAQRQKSSYVEKLKQANALALVAFRAPQKVSEGAYQPLLDSASITPEEHELFRHALSSSKRINAYLNWYRVNIPSFESIKPTDYWPTPDAQLEMPTLVVRGELDNVFVPHYVDRVRQIAKSIRVLELEGAGHWPHVEQSERVNQTLLDFLGNPP